MPFLGTTPTQGFVGANPKQSFTANGSTTVFTLTHPVANANDLEVFVGNVRQEPTAAYSAAGTTLTMTEAPDTGLNFYVINKSQAQVTTTPPTNSISTDKLINDSVTTTKLADTISGAHTFSGGVTLSGTTTHSGALNVAGTSAFTGATTTLNGFNLLSTYNETAANINLNSDTLIHDIGTTNLATYSQFLVHSYILNQSNGTAHVYFLYKGSNDTAKQFQGQLHGQGSQAGNNVPFQGDNTYIRTAFRLAQGHFNMVKQVITNAPTTSGMPSPEVDHHGVIYEVQWVYSGVQTSHAQGSIRGTSNSTPTQKVFLNVDPGDSGGLSGNSAFRVISHLWGVK